MKGCVELDDRRIFERFRLSFAVSFLNVGNGRPGVGIIRDISAKGIGITVCEELPPKISLELWLKIPDREPLYARGNVIWCRKDPDRAFHTGIHLERAVLMEFCSNNFLYRNKHKSSTKVLTSEYYDIY